jgi:hypothetical protein
MSKFVRDVGPIHALIVAQSSKAGLLGCWQAPKAESGQLGGSRCCGAGPNPEGCRPRQSCRAWPR